MKVRQAERETCPYCGKEFTKPQARASHISFCPAGPYREKMLKKRKAQWTPERKKARSEKRKGVPRPDHSLAMREYWSDPERRARMSEKMQGNRNSSGSHRTLKEGRKPGSGTAPKSKEHLERISDGVSKAITEGRFSPDRHGYGIITEYGGVTYPSRTEARWAEVLALQGLRYEHRPAPLPYRDARGVRHWYHPDFLDENGVYWEPGRVTDRKRLVVSLVEEQNGVSIRMVSPRQVTRTLNRLKK